MTKCIGFFDGACEPVNPCGIATYGCLIYRDGGLVFSKSGIAATPFSERSTNNVGEYTGLVVLLENGLHLGISDIEIFGDSQLAVRQVSGLYSVNSKHILPLYGAVMDLLKQYRNVKLEWVPRERNSMADELSHEAYEAYLDENQEARNRIQGLFATEKQKAFMNSLGIKFDRYIGKREASRLISRHLSSERSRGIG